MRRAPLWRWRAFLALVAAVIAVVAAATSAAKTPLTAADYRAKATAICVALNRYQIPINVSFVAGMQGALEKTRSSVAALRRLDPPASLRSLHAQAVQEETQLVADFAALIAKARNHILTPAKVVAALGNDAHARRAASLWRRLAVPVCAS